jgi:hypothetical protein
MQKQQKKKSNAPWPKATSLSLVLTGLVLAGVSFLSVLSMPDLPWHPARDAELTATYNAYKQTGILLIKETGSGSQYVQAAAASKYSAAALDDDPGVYILASIFGHITGSDSPYPGLKIAQGLLVAVPLLWLPTAVARVFRRARAGYALLAVPPVLWLVNGGTILLGTQYGLSDSISITRVYALYGVGASLTFFSLSMLLLASTYRFKLPGLMTIGVGFGILAGLGNLTRSLSGFGLALAVGVIWWINTKHRFKILKMISGALIAITVAVGFGTSSLAFLNTERAQATGQEVSELPTVHSTWHPLYLGLSYPQPITGEPSDLGIIWSDEFGWNVARAANPNVLIAGEEYDAILRDAFIAAVQKQPYEAVKTYIEKFLYVIKHFGAMIFAILLGIGLGISRPGAHRKPLIVASLLTLPVLAIGLAPPVLVMPMLYYFSDLSAGLGLLLALSIGSIVWYVTTISGYIRTVEKARISGRIESREKIESAPCELGVVIPCRNGESVIGETIRELESNLSSKDEIIVVENGSTDQTSKVLSEILATWSSRVKLKLLISEPGLGNALRVGVLASESRRLLITADDLPFGISDLFEFRKLSPDSLLAIGSKAHPNSIVTRASSREIQSKVFRILRGAFLQSKIGDSQGTLWVDGVWARTFAILSRETGLMWTTEMVFAAEQQGLEIAEVPVRLVDSHASVQSRFSFRDGLRSLSSFVKFATYRDEYSVENWKSGKGPSY